MQNRFFWIAFFGMLWSTSEAQSDFNYQIQLTPINVPVGVFNRLQKPNTKANGFSLEGVSMGYTHGNPLMLFPQRPTTL